MITNKTAKYSNQFISYFLPTDIIDTFILIAFVLFVDTISITDIISLNGINEVSAILFKYSSFSQIDVLEFQL